MSTRRRRPSAVNFGQALDSKSEALRRDTESAPTSTPEPVPESVPVPGPSPTARFSYRTTIAEALDTDRMTQELRSLTGNRRLTKGDMLRALARVASEDPAVMQRAADVVESLEKLARQEP